MPEAIQWANNRVVEDDVFEIYESPVEAGMAA